MSDLFGNHIVCFPTFSGERPLKYRLSCFRQKMHSLCICFFVVCERVARAECHMSVVVSSYKP